MQEVVIDSIPEVVIDSIPELVKNLAAINRGRRALYRGQRRNLPLLPKVCTSVNLPAAS